MTLAARFDDIGKPALIAVMILSFVFFWPLGLVVLGFLIGSGRMACWDQGRGPRWQRRMERWQRRMAQWQERAEQFRGGAGGGGGGCWGRPSYSASSGNRAFDEYRDETLRRLEEEQREFREFLDRLRHAKDKAEFDQFMAERGRRSDNPAPPPQQ
ncbi:MAG: DUF2852 domain-containing protein [Alphaproteobacteria bacterium]|nr:DUF2852 domain-containing protein [Alphaproteobacteria bacterium]